MQILFKLYVGDNLFTGLNVSYVGKTKCSKLLLKLDKIFFTKVSTHVHVVDVAGGTL